MADEKIPTQPVALMLSIEAEKQWLSLEHGYMRERVNHLGDVLSEQQRLNLAFEDHIRKVNRGNVIGHVLHAITTAALVGMALFVVVNVGAN